MRPRASRRLIRGNERRPHVPGDRRGPVAGRRGPGRGDHHGDRGRGGGGGQAARPPVPCRPPSGGRAEPARDRGPAGHGHRRGDGPRLGLSARPERRGHRGGGDRLTLPPNVRGARRAGLAPRRRGSGREPLEEVRPGRQLPPVTSLPSVPEKQPRYGGPEREPAHVRPVGYAAAHVGAHAANPAEQLEDEPEPQEGDGRELDRGDEEEDDERVDTGMGEQDEVRAQDGGDGPGGPKVRDGGRGSDGELEARGCQAAQQVEDQVQPRFQPILDVVAEDPKVEHVAPDVEPAAVQEHRHEDRQVHVLVWAPLLERPLKLCPAVRPQLRPNGGAELQRALQQRCPDKNVNLSILVAMFLHGGWLHIGGNMLYLWIFGNNVEDRLKPGLYLVFYLL